MTAFSSGFQTAAGNASYLYYAKDNPVTVHRLGIASGLVDDLGQSAGGVSDFFVDSTYAYWVERGTSPDYANGRVRRVAHDSTKPETLAVSVVRPVALGVLGNRVFVASGGTSAAGYADGAILRLTLGQ